MKLRAETRWRWGGASVIFSALMRILPFLFFALLAFVGPASLRADEYEARTFSGADSAQLGYRLLTPKNFDAKDTAKKYPLVLVLHGAGERGTDNAAQLKYGAPLFLKPEVRDQYPCFVVVPQCPPDQKWAAGKDWVDGAEFLRRATDGADEAPARGARWAAQGISGHQPGSPLCHRSFDGRLRDLGFAHAAAGTLGGGGADLRWE